MSTIKQVFGDENILGGAIHRDETTPHLHLFVTPIRDCVVKKKQTKDEMENKIQRTETIRKLSASSWTDGPAKIHELQETMSERIYSHLNCTHVKL